jgi:hypothetical protein
VPWEKWRLFWIRRDCVRGGTGREGGTAGWKDLAVNYKGPSLDPSTNSTGKSAIGAAAGAGTGSFEVRNPQIAGEA